MYRILKGFNKSTFLKISLFILIISTIVMLTACGGEDDDDEIAVNNGEREEIVESEISFNLTASIVDGESTVGKLTDDKELGTGYRDSEGTDTYDPDNPFKITRDARPIRRIIKQDVYGNILTDNFYFYRNLLSKSEKHLYDQIYANAVDLDPYFKLTTKIQTDRIRDIFDSVRLDNPDLFWLTTGYSYSYDNNNNVTSMTLKFYDMVNNLDAYKKTFYDCADSVLEVAMNLDNDIDKVKYIHDLMTNVNTYEFGPLDQSAYSSICVGKTVCAGYSNGFQYYMQRLGIPTTVLFGDAGGNHAWSLVELDGEYYEMDVTWDDPVSNPPNTYYYNYFNITTSQIAPTRTRGNNSGQLPNAKGTVYSFPNWYGSDPGRDFSSITYGKPKTNLPHLYPDFDLQPNQNIAQDKDKDKDKVEDKPEDNDDVMDRDKMESIIEEWSDEEWEDFWDEMSEVYLDEELDEIFEMDWDDFIDLIYDIYFGE